MGLGPRPSSSRNWSAWCWKPLTARGLAETLLDKWASDGSIPEALRSTARECLLHTTPIVVSHDPGPDVKVSPKHLKINWSFDLGSGFYMTTLHTFNKAKKASHSSPIDDGDVFKIITGTGEYVGYKNPDADVSARKPSVPDAPGLIGSKNCTADALRGIGERFGQSGGGVRTPVLMLTAFEEQKVSKIDTAERQVGGVQGDHSFVYCKNGAHFRHGDSGTPYLSVLQKGKRKIAIHAGGGQTGRGLLMTLKAMRTMPHFHSDKPTDGGAGARGAINVVSSYLRPRTTGIQLE